MRAPQRVSDVVREAGGQRRRDLRGWSFAKQTPLLWVWFFRVGPSVHRGKDRPPDILQGSTAVRTRSQELQDVEGEGTMYTLSRREL